MWRAYDFSVEALEDRLQAANLHVPRHLWRDWSQHRVKNIDGTNFLVTHIPRIGPLGEDLLRTESEIANAKHLIGQFNQKGLRDGT